MPLLPPITERIFKMKLLIAEDDDKLLKSLTHIFEKNHYVVNGVQSGNDALSYAQSESMTAPFWTL